MNQVMTDTMAYRDGVWFRFRDRAFISSEDKLPEGLRPIAGSKRREIDCFQNIFGELSDAWSYQIEGWVSRI